MQENRADALAAARALLAAGGTATLATLNPDGAPFASHVVAAAGPGGAPVLLLSRLAVHTQNLGRDPRASLLLVGAPTEAGDAMTAPRLTLVGRVEPHADAPAARRAYLAAHRQAELYAGFADFGFFAFAIVSAHVVAGFGRIVGLSAADLLGER